MKVSDVAAWLAENPDLAEVNSPLGKSPSQMARSIAGGEMSDLEATFLQAWKALKGPALEQEYTFDPARMWRFDFAHPLTRIAIEIEGGTHSQGRHTRHDGFKKDAVKYNAAQLKHGWRVIRFTSDMIDAYNILPVIEAIDEEMGRKPVTITDKEYQEWRDNLAKADTSIDDKEWNFGGADELTRIKQLLIAANGLVDDYQAAAHEANCTVYRLLERIDAAKRIGHAALENAEWAHVMKLADAITTMLAELEGG